MNLTEFIAVLARAATAVALAWYWLRPRRLPAPRAQPTRPAALAASDAATQLRRELAGRAQATRQARASARASARPALATPPRGAAQRRSGPDFAETTLLGDDPR